MPNTLAHLGVQGFLGRAARPAADPKWIALGCVLPDLPWIWQRALRGVFAGLGRLEAQGPFDALYDLRLYAVVQASLLWCLLLALAVAMVARRRLEVFGVLALGAVLHLLLDAIETKWGNGVVLLAPFDWRERNAGWFWPESGVATCLTLLGVVWWVASWRRAVAAPPELDLQPRRLVLAGLLAAAYLVTPIAFLRAAEAGGGHSIATLRAHRSGDPSARVGERVELQRAFYRHRDGMPVVRTIVEEELEVPGLELRDGDRVSLRARFVAARRLEVEEWHLDRAAQRDATTYVGLLAIAALWLGAWWRASRRAVAGAVDTGGASQSPQGSSRITPSDETR